MLKFEEIMLRDFFEKLMDCHCIPTDLMEIDIDFIHMDKLESFPISTRGMWNYDCLSDSGSLCSNYDIFLTRDCLAYSKVKPAVNQIETHPYFQRDSLVKFCLKHGICVTAHTPLGGAAANTEWFGSVSCLDDPILKVRAKTLYLIQIASSAGQLYYRIKKNCFLNRLCIKQLASSCGLIK